MNYKIIFMKKKNLLKSISVALAFGMLAAGCSAQRAAEQGWKDYSALVKKIVPPTFADKDFSVLDYGAKADGSTDCLPAIKAAISACNKAGGGRVLIPSGNY